MTACIVGWAHTPFGKLDTETVESLIVRVTAEALEHAGIGPEDVDEVVLGHFNGGFSAQDFTASLVFQANAVFDAVEALPQIVIAGLNGVVRAGGAELALACDIRLAASHATLGDMNAPACHKRAYESAVISLAHQLASTSEETIQ